MVLHDSIISAYSEGFSGVYVKCNTPVEAAEEFQKMFENAFAQAMDDLEEEYGASCMEKEEGLDCPSTTVQIDDTTFLVRLGPLFLSVNDGVRADNDYLTNALENTLKELKEQVPGLSYWGMIGYEWHDEHCGDVISYEIGSDNASHDTYPFIKDVFIEILEDEDSLEEFLEKFKDNVDMCEEEDIEIILECLEKYSLPEEFMLRIKEILEELKFD